MNHDEYETEKSKQRKSNSSLIIDENSENSNNFVRDNEDYEQRNEISERISQEKLRSGDGIYCQIEDVSIFIRRSLNAASKKLQRQLSRYEKEDIERRISLEYAKVNRIWINDLYSLGIPFTGGGNENTLAYDNSKKIIYKSNNLINYHNSILSFLSGIKIHNEIFPETRYELVGFTGIDNGINRAPYIEVILKQDYVPNAIQASEKEITNYMQSLGFTSINKHTFFNHQYIISDLRPRNVLKSHEGDIFVVDDIIKEKVSST
ncbi:hypothetical protein LJC06_02540 [Bacteroidales bacterium OttesenSCG-928-I14]|nr:hypothetical protein [Bacteroidales bacterium OttesenSCG-928-I14]